MISKNEQNSDYAFMFKAIKDSVQNVYNFDYKPSILIADAAEGITIGFQTIFELKSRVVCWAHVIRAIDAKLIPIKDPKIRNMIRFDIKRLQESATKLTFETGILLLKKKWTDNQEDSTVITFFNYFEYWLTPLKRGWYEGMANGVPSQNNGLEATNGWVKKSGTLRDQCTLNEFLVVLDEKLIVPWSKERNTVYFHSTKEFHLYPPIDTSLWTQSYKYHQEKRRVIKAKFAGINYQCVGCSNVIVSNNIVVNITKKLQDLSFENFNDFIDSHTQVRWICLNSETYQLGTCSCRTWAKNYICKHVISMSKTAGYFQSFPAVDIAIESKNKRGRKPLEKATAALTRQEYLHHTQELFPNLTQTTDTVSTCPPASTSGISTELTPVDYKKRRGRSALKTLQTMTITPKRNKKIKRLSFKSI